ncbi:unnamed protein product [Ectocarpus sp. 4 AP-2014]
MAGCDWLHPAEVDRLHAYNRAALHLRVGLCSANHTQVGFFTPLIHLSLDG